MDGKPPEVGFDRSYHLEDCGRYFGPQVHFEDGRPLPQPRPGSGYYATAAIAEHAVRFLREHAAAHAGTPFFLYLCFTAPHFPLHALPEDIARYRDRYRSGWDAIRGERWARLKAMGIAHHALPALEPEVGPPYHFPEALEILGPGEVDRPLPWAELSDARREFQAAKMAVHAAMIDRMDREIGRLLDQVRAMGAEDDTLVLFLSDNGASAEIMVRDDGHDPSAPPGSAASHLCLGPGWSSAANTPFRRHKTWVHEGGISTPLILRWPRGVPARGELRHTPGHVIDLVPTILQLAGGRPPATWNGQPVPPLPGRSLVPVLARDGNLKRDCLWWRHEGNRAIRIGDWKLVASGEDAPWELYDLRTDRGETRNLARQRSGKARELAKAWEARDREFRRLAAADLGRAPGASRPGPVGGRQ